MTNKPAVNQSDLRNGLQTVKTGQAPALDPGMKVQQYFKGLESKISEVLPKHVSAATLTRIAITEIRTNPKLLECSLVSLAGAVMKSAQLGLQLGLLGHCYLVPYKDEATFILGYKGMIELARRSGNTRRPDVQDPHPRRSAGDPQPTGRGRLSRGRGGPGASVAGAPTRRKGIAGGE